jgi:hypothetical protein
MISHSGETYQPASMMGCQVPKMELLSYVSTIYQAIFSGDIPHLKRPEKSAGKK